MSCAEPGCAVHRTTAPARRPARPKTAGAVLCPRRLRAPPASWEPPAAVAPARHSAHGTAALAEAAPTRRPPARPASADCSQVLKWLEPLWATAGMQTTGASASCASSHQYADDRRRLSELCELLELEEVRALAEAAPVDFFTQQHWESVPARWRDDLLGLDEDELLRWACGRAGVRACGRAGVRACGRAGARARGRAGVRACGRAGVRACACVRWSARRNAEACAVPRMRADSRPCNVSWAATGRSNSSTTVKLAQGHRLTNARLAAQLAPAGSSPSGNTLPLLVGCVSAARAIGRCSLHRKARVGAQRSARTRKRARQWRLSTPVGGGTCCTLWGLTPTTGMGRAHGGRASCMDGCQGRRRRRFWACSSWCWV